MPFTTSLRGLTLVLAALSCLAFGLPSRAAPEAGKQYLVLRNAPPVQGNKIEVIEAFSYQCPHCYEFEPKLKAWLKRQSADITYRRIPVVFQNSWAAPARAYLTLEAMGEIDRLHDKIFHAIHEQDIALGDEQILFDWIGKQGIDAKKFAEVYKSFGVQSKFQRAQQLGRAYAVMGVPTMIVQGKYQTSGTQAGSYDGILAVTDHLISLVRSEKAAAK